MGGIAVLRTGDFKSKNNTWFHNPAASSWWIIVISKCKGKEDAINKDNKYLFHSERRKCELIYRKGTFINSRFSIRSRSSLRL